jgi:hypothetical protein
MSTVYVVSYFYPDGTYAGMIGAYKNPIKAQDIADVLKLTDYPDCTFAVTRVEVE